MISVETVRALAGSGLENVERHRRRINALNVYPVPDGDTGTNLTLTMQGIVDELDRSTAKTTAELAADVQRAATMEAKGNSGVILSTIVRGWRASSASTSTVDGEILADAIRSRGDERVPGGEGAGRGDDADRHPRDGRGGGAARGPRRSRSPRRSPARSHAVTTRSSGRPRCSTSSASPASSTPAGQGSSSSSAGSSTGSPASRSRRCRSSRRRSPRSRSTTRSPSSATAPCSSSRARSSTSTRSTPASSRSATRCS